MAPMMCPTQRSADMMAETLAESEEEDRGKVDSRSGSVYTPKKRSESGYFVVQPICGLEAKLPVINSVYTRRIRSEFSVMTM